MSERLTTMLRDAAESLTAGAALAPGPAVFERGRRRHRRRFAVGGAALGAVALAAAGAVSTTMHGHERAAEQLATDGGPSGAAGATGRYDIVVTLGGPQPAELSRRLATCVSEAGAVTEDGATSTRMVFTTSTAAAANLLLSCAARQVGVARVTAVGPAGTAVARTFTYADLPSAVAGTLRETGIDSYQTWLADAHDGEGLQLCWGQANPFSSQCAGTNTRDGARSLNAGLAPPSENPSSRLIGGVAATDASAGFVLARGERLPAAVEHYDQFPGLAVVLARWTGEHVPGADFGPMQFLPQP